MKILYIAAANSTHSVRWVQYFVERGHNITWISLAPPLKEAEDLIKKTNFFEIKPSPLVDINGFFALRYLPGAVWNVRRILKDAKPDLIHAHYVGTYGLVGALSRFHPLVLSVWGSDILLPTGLKKKLVQYVLKQGDYITYDGYNTEKKLIELGVGQGKMEHVRFGIDLTRFKSLENHRTQEETVRIISLRNLEPVYDVESFIRAAAHVASQARNVEFIVAGDGSERKHLEELTRELGLQQRLKFIGRYDAKTLPQMLTEADVYVSTSLSESGLAASTSEAMAAGLPLVVSDSGDNKVWIEGKGGFVVPLKDPGSLAEKILYLVEHPAERKKFGAYNREITFEKNNYHKEMEKMEKIYERLISK